MPGKYSSNAGKSGTGGVVYNDPAPVKEQVGETIGRALATPWMLTNQNVYAGEDELNFNFGD